MPELREPEAPTPESSELEPLMPPDRSCSGFFVAELPMSSSFWSTRSVRPVRLSLRSPILPLDEPPRFAPKSLCDESDELESGFPRAPLRSDELESTFWSLLRSAILILQRLVVPPGIHDH